MGIEALLLRSSGTWIFEIAAAVFSALCFVGLLITLFLANSQIVETWRGITLNTVVSILATASRLSALFVVSTAIGQTKWNLFHVGPRSLLDFETIDRASRGVLGCAELLWRTRSIATLGAVAFVLAMGFEPFTQQLIQYEADVIFALDHDVLLPFARKYDSGTAVRARATNVDTLDLFDGGLEIYEYEADFDMQAAVLNGLTHSAPLLAQQVPLTCASGNCTWPLLESLAVCSACNNVTSALQQSVDDEPMIWRIAGDNTPPHFGDSTRFELPNGLWLSNYDDNGTGRVRMVAFGTGDREKTITMGAVDTLIWSMSMINAELLGANDTAVWPTDVRISASECALYYCVKTYNNTVMNSKVQQNVLGSYTRRSPESWQAVNAANTTELLSEAVLSSLEQALDYASSLQHTDLMLGDGFNLSQKAVMSTSSYFQSTFTDTGSVDENILNDNTMTGFYVFGDSARPRPPVMQRLYTGRDDFPSVFERIAESMSTVIRSSGEQQSGYGGHNVTRYRVQWPWIALPAAVVIASLLQLFTAIYSSKRKPLWKSSALATLSRGPFVTDVFGNAGTIVELTHAAEKRTVDLFFKESAHKDEASLLSSEDGST